jgi:hypothetical protein
LRVEVDVNNDGVHELISGKREGIASSPCDVAGALQRCAVKSYDVCVGDCNVRKSEGLLAALFHVEVRDARRMIDIMPMNFKRHIRVNSHIVRWATIHSTLILLR